MIIFVSQVYIGKGDYEFSHIFQKYTSSELTRLSKISPKFISTYDEDFKLIFRMSAKTALKENEVRGPTIFKKDKDVEYTIFLPFDNDTPMTNEKRKFGLQHLFLGIIEVLRKYDIDTSQIENEQTRIIETVLSDPTMNSEKFDFLLD